MREGAFGTRIFAANRPVVPERGSLASRLPRLIASLSRAEMRVASDAWVSECESPVLISTYRGWRLELLAAGTLFAREINGTFPREGTFLLHGNKGSSNSCAPRTRRCSESHEGHFSPWA